LTGDDGFGEVVVDGTPLPAFQSGGGDSAIGLSAPTVTGEDATGAEVTIGPDGRGKIVVAVAHWCPHCQAQVPVLQNWGGSGALPDSVDLYTLAVLTDRTLAEDTWTPGEWLAAEGWMYPTMLDDEVGSAATAFGVSGVPFFVVLDGDNNVLSRVIGELDAGQLDDLVLMVSESASANGTVPGDLGLQKPMARPDCDGSYVTFIGASVNPDQYAEEIAAYLTDYPDADYLRSDVTCASLRPATESGDAIYAVFFGPFATFGEACQARAQGPSGSYVKPLDNFSDPEQIPAC
jgi:thiol-disulfide isomerase/thioredoxin